MGTTRKYTNLEVDTITVKKKIILTNKDGAVIQVKGLKGSTLPTKLQFLDKDDVITHEFVLNTTDGTSGDIRHNGKIRRVV